MRCSGVRVVTIAVALCAGLISGRAGAVGFGFDIGVEGPTGQSMGSVSSSELPISSTTDPDTGNVTFTLDSPFNSGMWSLDQWTSVANVDPFVTNNFLVTNNSAVVQTYLVNVTLPIPAQSVDQFIASSITAQVLDSDGNAGTSAATLGQSGATPIYQAFINVAAPPPATLSLLPPVGVGALPATCGINGCFASAGAGPVGGAIAPVVATSIGIELNFTLTPGDSAALLSRFEVIPEPGTATLLGLGLVAIGVFRRRS